MKPDARAWLLSLGLVGLLAAAPRRPPAQPIDLNTATRTELLQLPRVGPRTAERILAFRQAHGPFLRAEELMAVKGIGEKTFIRLQPYIRVSGVGAPPSWADPAAGAGTGARKPRREAGNDEADPAEADGPSRPPRAGRPRSAGGSSLLELVLVLGGLGALGLAIGAGPGRGHAALAAVQGELRASVEQAFLLARARGGPVVLTLEAAGRGPTGGGRPADPAYAVLPGPRLARGVSWGAGAHPPSLPAGAGRTRQAHRTGRSRDRLIVTAARSAQAGAWYLNDGADVAYLGLGNHGEITCQRWWSRLRQWRRA
jgi:competence protein ComEA